MSLTTHERLSNLIIRRGPVPCIRRGPVPCIRRASVGDEGFRWTLVRQFEDAPRDQYLPWLMLNPSNADHARDDPTLKRVMWFSWSWGFAGCLVLNIYPFRTPSPAELAHHVIGWDERGAWDVRDDIWANHSRVKNELKLFDACMVAWGCPSGALGLETDGWVENLFEDIDSEREMQIQRWCLGRTKSGDPTHPLARGRSRVPDNVVPTLWRGG